MSSEQTRQSPAAAEEIREILRPVAECRGAHGLRARRPDGGRDERRVGVSMRDVRVESDRSFGEAARRCRRSA